MKRLGLLLAALLSTRFAGAQPCPPIGSAWVTLDTAAPASNPQASDSFHPLLNRVRTLLQAELERRHVVVCLDEAGTAATPSARITLVLLPTAGGELAAVEIRIDDALTHKSVSRRIELLRVPADSRALTIAVGADELLSASWAELSFSRRHLPQSSTAPDVPASLEVDRAKRRVDVALLGAGEVDRAGRVRLGAWLRNDWWLTRNIALLLRLGYLRGVAIEATHGTVLTDGFSAAGGAAVPVLERGAGGLELGIVARYMRTLVRGNPRPGASGSSSAFSSLAAEAELSGWWALGAELHRPRLALVSELGVGAWLRDVDARDGQQRLPLQRSPLLRVGLGLQVKIP